MSDPIHSAELARRIALYRTTLATLVEAVLVIDKNGRIEESNPAAERMLGVPGADLLMREVMVDPRLVFLQENG